jgi:cbb3-type cytochrome oxidase maturation protein
VNILAVLIPVSILLGLFGLVAFLWLLRNEQFEDPDGHAARILSDRYDDAPADDSVADAYAGTADEKARATGAKPAQSA